MRGRHDEQLAKTQLVDRIRCFHFQYIASYSCSQLKLKLAAKSMKRLLATALSVLLLLPLPAWASSHLSTDQTVAESRAMIEQGRFAEALDRLRPLPGDHPDRIDIDFLIGFAAISLAERTEQEDEKNMLLDEAITNFRSMLIRQPNLTRVRLELARAFFLKGEDDLSRQHFERVLSSEQPAPIVANVRIFLQAIRDRRRWNAFFNFSIVPEAKINRNRTILVPFGGSTLPFELDDTSTGAGVVLSAGFDYTKPLEGRWSMVYGIEAERTEYRGHAIDQSEIEFKIGPKLAYSADTEFAWQASLRRDFDGDNRYTNDIYGLRLDTSHRLSRKLSATSYISMNWDKFGNGPDSTLNAAISYYFVPTVVGTWRGALGRRKTKSAVGRNRTRLVEGGMIFVLPFGFTANAVAKVQLTDTERSDLVLGTGQRYRKVKSLQIGLLNRGFTFFGFSPKLDLVRQLSNTNYQLDTFDSTSYQLVFQRQF